MLYDRIEFIEEEDFGQIFSYDAQKERIEDLESQLALAKVELKMMTDMEKFWHESYEEVNKEFIKYLERK